MQRADGFPATAAACSSRTYDRFRCQPAAASNTAISPRGASRSPSSRNCSPPAATSSPSSPGPSSKPTRCCVWTSPTLGIDGACLSIIGQLGESRGVLIFPSLDGLERFLAAANASRREHGAITMGTGLLSLTFQHATELPPSMYREAMRNALPVESPDAYPLVAHGNPNGIPQPLGDRDVKTATACALALSAFLPKHAGIFQADSFTPVCESYFDDDDREVRFTVPYEAIADFKLNGPAEQERDDAYLNPTPPAEGDSGGAVGI